jgi:hypothetical protein
LPDVSYLCHISSANLVRILKSFLLCWMFSVRILVAIHRLRDTNFALPGERCISKRIFPSSRFQLYNWKVNSNLKETVKERKHCQGSPTTHFQVNAIQFDFSYVHRCKYDRLQRWPSNKILLLMKFRLLRHTTVMKSTSNFS